jgi:hypothetical protein
LAHVGFAHRFAFAQALAGDLADQLVGAGDHVAPGRIFAHLRHFDVGGSDGFARADGAAQNRQPCRGRHAALQREALGAGMVAARDQRGRETAVGAVELQLADFEVGRRFERQRKAGGAAAEIDFVAGAHAFGDQRLAQHRHDVRRFDRAAHALDEHAVEARLRTPGEIVGARDFHELGDLDRHAAAGGGRPQHGAVAVDAVEQVRQAHEIAFDDHEVAAQRLRVGDGCDRGRGEGRDGGGKQKGKAGHGRVPSGWISASG